MRLRRYSIAAVLLASAAPAIAETAAAAADIATVEASGPDETDPTTIIVVGDRETEYSVDHTASATRTATDLMRVPQAVTVITSEQIEDQAMRSLTDVLRFVPGVSISAGEGHRDQIAIRGNLSTSDFFVDGLRDDVQYYRGLYNLDRVEVLKGPNAMIFGRGSGGGVVNRVTKRPLQDVFSRGAISYDRYGAWFTEADVNSTLGGQLAGRLNAVYEKFDGFRDEYGGQRVGFNPTLAWLPGPATRVDVGFEYARDRRLIDRGIPSRDGRPLEGFEEVFFGDEDVNLARFNGRVGDLRVEHLFSPSLKLVSKALYGDYDKFYRNALPATPVTLIDGVERVGIEAYQAPTERQNLLFQNDLVAEITTGDIAHTLLAGVDYANQRTHAQRTQGFFDSGVPTSSGGRRYFAELGDTIFVPPITFRDGPGRNNAKSRLNAFGLYVQDQARIGDSFEIVAGLRRDWFDLEVDNLISGQSFERTDSLWSPRLGLLFRPAEQLSLYASWTRSFLPQSGEQFASLDPTTAALEPERFTNREIGLKWQPLPLLDVTLAAYQLDRTNTRETDPATLLTVLTGEQRSEGVELTVQGRPMERLALSGGLAFQDVEVRRSANPALVGRKAPFVPDFQGSLWARYDFTNRLAGGLGIYHQSKTFASISNAVVVPAFTRLDAAGFFKLTREMELQLNVDNLLNEDYIGVAYNDNNLTPASRRTVRATLRFGM